MPPTVTPTATFGTPTSHELVTNQGSAQLNLVHTFDVNPIAGTSTPVAVIPQVIAPSAQATFAIDAQTAIPNGFQGYDHLTGDQPFTAVNQ